MRVLLNFLPILGRGGGRQNALNLWDALGRHGGAGHQWLAVTRSNLALDAPPAAAGMDVTSLPVEGAGVGGGRFRAENVTLLRMARTFGAQVVFTPMGTGPLWAPVPRVSGWHDGTSVYADSPMWRGHSGRELVTQRLRVAYAAVALHGVSRVCVQTRTMGRRVSATFGVPEARIHVVPNGLSSFLAREAAASDPEERTQGGPRRILVVTTAQPAKNLPALPHTARALAGMGLGDVEIVATLDPGEGARAMGVARPRGVDPEIVVPGPVPVRCVGSVPHRALGDLYRSGAAVLAPSWVESFTAVYPEAWHFGLPVITSDLDFARDLCGDGALYGDPLVPSTFAAPLARALEEPDVRAALRSAGRRRLERLPSWDRRLELYLAALEAAVPFA